MTVNNKILRIILLTIFGSLFAYKLYQTAQEIFFLDGIILLVIALVGFIIFILTIFKDSKEFKTSQELTSFVPTSIGLLFILTNIGLFYFQNSKSNSPTLISGFYDGDINGFSVDFKTDGKYVMANGSGFGESYFYGTYTLKDSIITIDKSNIDNCIKTNTLVIRTEQYFLPLDTISKIGQANYITQLDSKGIEIDKGFRFHVIVDNRNNANK